MANVTVEYRRARPKLNGKHGPIKIADLSKKKTRVIQPSSWAVNRGTRTVEDKARWLVHQYGLIEDAIHYAYDQMIKYESKPEEFSYDFWRGVYKWLRRHEDLARRAPHLVGHA